MKYHNIPTLFDNQASLINGKNIGTDSVRYIQDAGQKTAGTTYIDRNTNELYVCVKTTNSVNNDSNFSKFNLKEAFNKLDSLKDKIWYDPDNYWAKPEDELIYPGEYQINSRYSTLPPGFCGTQCFVVVRNTNTQSPEDGWVTQVAYSYNPEIGYIAFRVRPGSNTDESQKLKWFPWRFIKASQL